MDMHLWSTHGTLCIFDNIVALVCNSSRIQLPSVHVQTERGQQQARDAGQKIRYIMEQASRGGDYQLFFYTSPYKRSLQTYEGIR